MDIKILERSQTPLISLRMIKQYLRIQGDDHDELLSYYLSVATEWVENRLNKAFLKQKRSVTHDNNCFRLPFGPVIEVLSVRQNKKTLNAKDYQLIPKGDSVIIQAPFHWKSPKIEVVYSCGFGENPDHIPQVFKQAVLGTLEHLYRHNGSLEDLDAASTPWLNSYQPYRLEM